MFTKTMVVTETGKIRQVSIVANEGEVKMRRLNRLSALALSSTMLATFAITPAYAQDAQADEESYENEPIVVTATLREADVQDIPIAVTAVQPETLER